MKFALVLLLALLLPASIVILRMGEKGAGPFWETVDLLGQVQVDPASHAPVLGESSKGSTRAIEGAPPGWTENIPMPTATDSGRLSGVARPDSTSFYVAVGVDPAGIVRIIQTDAKGYVICSKDLPSHRQPPFGPLAMLSGKEWQPQVDADGFIICSKLLE